MPGRPRPGILATRAHLTKPSSRGRIFSLGVLEARTRIVESGMAVLELAGYYGYPDPAAIAREISGYEASRHSRKLRGQALLCAAACIPLALVAFLVIAWRKKWFFLTDAAWRKHRQMKGLDTGS